MRWRVALIAAMALVATAAGCTAPKAQWREAEPAPSGGSGAIAWHDCADDARRIASDLGTRVPRGVHFECGRVAVPQDWNTAVDGHAPDGKSFTLALMRARSDSQADRIGSVLINPGGPGASGREFTVSVAIKASQLLRRFDLIGFDPRGVGESNSVDCISDADLDASFGYEPDPAANADFLGLVNLSRKIADECGAKYGEDLRLFSTEQTARDIDAIRAAVGDQKLTYLGFSYGTLLGAVYARLFPTGIRAMVLDGAVDPREAPIEASEGQARGFERAFANFVAWCGKNTNRCPIAPDARAAVLSALDHARTNPVKASDGRSATAGWVFLAVVLSLYSETFWPHLARGLDQLSRGDPTLIFVLADIYAEREPNGRYSNQFDVSNAVNCADSDQYPTVEDIRALQSDWRKRYPIFGAPLALSMLTCAVWPGKRDPYPIGPATGSPPIVVVGTTGDPATPYEATPKLAQLLGTGTVVTWQGEGHTAYLEDGAACVRNAVDGYLIDLKVPARNLTCPAR